MTVSAGTFDDLEPDRGQPIDRNPDIPCRICGETFGWRDYWADRVDDYSDHRKAPLWCDECEAEIERIRQRLSANKSLDAYAGGDSA